MTETPDDAWLIALGSAISDGAPLDWDELERHAPDTRSKRIVRQMRGLSRIVDAHRSDGADEGEPSGAPASSAARHWRHIVLFEAVGAGAFGTVHRGWDPTLDREVAVKLFKTGGGSVSPLEEGRHLARVHHSNVVTVYGADHEGDEVGIWMEYVEGHTLAEMIHDRGPMSAREVAGVGIDLCRALAALHGAGLLHRDIKAQNVMREFGGRIVLMDFSGAHAVTRNNPAVVTSGTPLYMAPEVLNSGAATFASDVYSLGVLLFFLLTGRLPVEGKTIAELKQAHQQGRRKRLRDLRPDVPDPVVQVVERAIAVDSAERYQTAGEFEHALTTASGSQPLNPSATLTRRPWTLLSGWTWLTLAALLLAGSVIGALASRLWKTAPASAPLTRFEIGPPFNSGSWPRVSPDGRLVVFGAIVEGRNRLWIRALGDLNGRALMNTTANETPFWSPDSSSLGFFEDGKLKRVTVDSGDAPTEVLADAPQPHGGDWKGQSILFSRADGIYLVDLANQGTVTKITTLDSAQGEYQHGWPEFLPDGRRFLFVIRSSRPERSGVYLTSIDGAPSRWVMPALSRVRYVDGHLLFVRQGTLVAQPFNARTATLEGQPLPLFDRIKYHGASDAAFDVSGTGVLVYGETPGESRTRLMLLDGRGRELQPLGPTGYYRNPRFAPDGRRIVAERIDPDDRNVDLWLYDLSRGGVGRLTSAAGPDVRPAWSPDGRRVVFSSKRGPTYGLYSKSVDTTEADQPLAIGPDNTFVEHWSPDGRFLSGTVLRSGLWIFPLDRDAKPWMVRSDPRAETWQSEFSPDGRWLAYMSSESGKPEIYVEPFPATGARWQVSTHGGAAPHWRSGGKELLYLAPDGMLMATGVTEDGWQKSSPIPLFHLSVPDLVAGGDYTVSPDGDRLVVNTFIADPLIPPIDVVVNWTALLRR